MKNYTIAATMIICSLFISLVNHWVESKFFVYSVENLDKRVVARVERLLRRIDERLQEQERVNQGLQEGLRRVERQNQK